MTETTSSSTTAGSKVTNSISRKRKADALSDASGDLPHLPAPVWGHVLDFMPYTEVRSALLVGKHIAVEAAKYASTLNIVKESEMYIPAARRFTNVEEVNILCLLQGTGEFEPFEENYTISSGVVNRTIPFLLGFSKLRRSFLGGFTKCSDTGNMRFRRYYFPPDCVGPKNDKDIFRSLLTLLISASKTGALPKHFMLDGMFDSALFSHPSNGPGHKTSE